MRTVRVVAPRARAVRVSLAALLTACAGQRATTSPMPAAPAGVAAPRVVDAGAMKSMTFAQLADAAAKADVVFFGEQHDDAETHRAELALLTAIGARRTTVVLALEMFERDVQPLLDDYLAGRISEADFRARARPWPNYETDYRPLVELAKARHWPVVASNVPRRLASMVSRAGLAAVDTLNATDRAYVAQQVACPKDQYYTNFVEVMGGGHGAAAPAPGAPSMAAMTDRFYEAQCIKDETMAESIVRAREKAGAGAIVVHYNGAFHSDYGLGTAARVVRRVPTVRSVVISAVPVPDPASAATAELRDRGQYLVIVQRIEPVR